MMLETSSEAKTAKTNTEDTNTPILVAEDIIKIYSTGNIDTQALRGVSFKVYPREKVFLIGPSGSGKTTLVNIVAGIDKPSSGKVFWRDLSKDITLSSYEEIIRARRNFAGVIFQDSKLLPHLTVKENIELAGYYAKIQAKMIKKRSKLLMKFLGIWEQRNKREDTLSGGEKKRVEIATTLISNPKILIGDEPTGDLDVKTAETILNLFDKINQELGIAICIVTHSQQVASRADRILELRDGIIVGQHNNKIHLRNLEESRVLEIDRQNRIVLPNEILHKLSNPKHFSLCIEDERIILAPVYETIKYSTKNIVTCSICGNRVENEEKRFCPHCGAAIIQKKR